MLSQISWQLPTASSTGTLMVQSIELMNAPSLAGNAIYFALQWRPAVVGTKLALLIDDGSHSPHGDWQWSNASGIICDHQTLPYCDQGLIPSAEVTGWTTRVRPAVSF
jgi:hypothetical protein